MNFFQLVYSFAGLGDGLGTAVQKACLRERASERAAEGPLQFRENGPRPRPSVRRSRLSVPPVCLVALRDH